MSASLIKDDILVMIIQYLHENNLKETAHLLEKESGVFLDIKYVEELVKKGKWEDVETYLSGFTKSEDNQLSDKMFFEIRNQKHFETLRKGMMTEGTQSVRTAVFSAIKILIEENPVFRGKLQFCITDKLTLGTLVNQSLPFPCWNAQPESELESLFVNHACKHPSNSRKPLGVTSASLYACGSAHTSVFRGGVTDLFTLSHPSIERVPFGRITPAESSKIRWLTEITEPSRCHSFRLIDFLSINCQVSRLTYSSSGTSIFALWSNGINSRWDWQNYQYRTGQETTSEHPRIWRPPNGEEMLNEGVQIQNGPVSCFALSNDETHLLSASGGRISCFNMLQMEKTMLLEPLSRAMVIAFQPHNDDIVAIGLENSFILVLRIRFPAEFSIIKPDQVKLKGHCEKVLGLAFSVAFSLLVSVGADDQLFVWDTVEWSIKHEEHLKCPFRPKRSPCAGIDVQFDRTGSDFLVAHESQIATYKASRLKFLNQWVTPESSSPIVSATYSCDGLSIYVAFGDGKVGVFCAKTLAPVCGISPEAYLSIPISARPLVIAAHPFKANQLAIGLTNGGICVLEPLDLKRPWGFEESAGLSDSKRRWDSEESAGPSNSKLRCG